MTQVSAPGPSCLFYLLVSSVDNICKHIEIDLTLLFNTLMVFLRELFKTDDFEEKKTAEDKYVKPVLSGH